MTNPVMPDATRINVRQPEILQRIGTIVTHWAFFEAVIEDIMAGFLGSELHWVYTITAEINIGNKVEALRALSRLRLSDADFATFQSRLNAFKELIPLRNKIVHGLWAETNDPDLCQVSAVKSRGKLKFQTEYMNAAYLDWLLAQIEKTGMAIFQFGQDFGVINKPDKTS